ncbi:hypothetical protein Vqi01_26950 [Micromonospora qiuiae]|uniref:Uncharacterized protein n=1 Tax=Micromonospora qiuiae TaxID=502268 RepID=A0ABQ4JBI6_9ACTN|nr:hypothetical protein Vqi01_26950 [Micromonospora qiuiae]
MQQGRGGQRYDTVDPLVDDPVIVRGRHGGHPFADRTRGRCPGRAGCSYAKGQERKLLPGRLENGDVRSW